MSREELINKAFDQEMRECELRAPATFRNFEFERFFSEYSEKKNQDFFF
jgi:hypothetical protein